MSIEEMKAELEAAGYQIYMLGYSQWRCAYPDRETFTDTSVIGDDERGAFETLTSKVYRHYQHEQQFAQMKELLKEITNRGDLTEDGDEWEDLWEDAADWIEKAKVLLEGMKDVSET